MTHQATACEHLRTATLAQKRLGHSEALFSAILALLEQGHIEQAQDLTRLGAQEAGEAADDFGEYAEVIDAQARRGGAA